jgi:hypothetical protein
MPQPESGACIQESISKKNFGNRLKNGKLFTVESSQKACFSQILPLLRHRLAVPGKKIFFEMYQKPCSLSSA